MAEIPRQRDIIDRRVLAAQLDAIAEDSAEPDRKRVAETLKAGLIAGRDEVKKRFEAGDAIYDLAHTPHLIARNASDSLPLRFLMTFVVAKGDPTILPLPPPK